MSNQGSEKTTTQRSDDFKQRNQRLGSLNKVNMPSKSSQKKCIFCKKLIPKKMYQTHFSVIINRALYAKYSSSQAYYYTKDINDLLFANKTYKVIRFLDWEYYDEEEEYLKRFYKNSEYNIKVKTLIEYYKFHNDIPRMFMKPTSDIINKYHDKKRRLEYIRITNMLDDEQKNSKEIPTKDNPEKFIMDRVLDDLNFTNYRSKGSSIAVTGQAEIANKIVNPSKGVHNTSINNEATKPDIAHKYFQNQALQKVSYKNGDGPQPELSSSITIQEIYLKLGEIINGSSPKIVNLDMLHDKKASRLLSNQSNSPQMNSYTANFHDFVDTDLFKTTQTNLRPILYTSPTENVRTQLTMEEENNIRSSLATHIKAKIKQLKELESNIPKTASRCSTTRKSHRQRANQASANASEGEITTTKMSTERVSSQTNSIKREKIKRRAASVAKIRDFEEIFRIQHQNTTSKTNSQRSASGEKAYKRSMPIVTLGDQVLQEKVGPKVKEGVSSTSNLNRRKSAVNTKDSISVSSNVHRKEKQILNNKYAADLQNPKAKAQSKASARKNIKISVDTGNQPSQQLSFNNSTNLTGTGKNLTSTSQIKGFLNTANNLNMRIISQNSMTSRVRPKSKEANKISEMKGAKLKSRLLSRDRSSSGERQGSENDLVSLKHLTEDFYGKVIKRVKNKRLTHHAKTKSEESVNNVNQKEKTNIPIVTEEALNPQPLNLEEEKNLEDENSNGLYVHTYNNSNIVNIFMNSQKGNAEINKPFVIIAKDKHSKICNKDTKSKIFDQIICIVEDPERNDPRPTKVSQLLTDRSKERINKSPIQGTKKPRPTRSKSKSNILENTERINSNITLTSRKKGL